MKEFIQKDSEGRNRVFITSTCSICEKEYTRQKRFLNKYNTCSTTCTHVAKGETLEVICAHCGIKFRKSKSKAEASKSGLYFCCRAHKDIGQTYIKEVQPYHYGTGEGKNTYRILAFKYLENKCNRCGYSENKAALIVHHKNRDRTNNELVNLEILCANCHAIEHWG